MAEVAARVREIGTEANRRFVARERQVEILQLAALTGEHVLFYGPTGTAKSSLVRFFAGSMGLTFFRRVLNPDTTREDLIGPIDPIALGEGRWERAWAGLATAGVALLDEIGKAGAQVSNMLLDAIEERRVTSGNIDMPIPLHMAVAASNETLERDLDAVHDRFLFRDLVGYVKRPRRFVDLLTSNASSEPLPHDGLTLEDWVDSRRTARGMAARPAPDVIDMVLKLRLELDTVTEQPVSDRRWRGLIVAAAGKALLEGRREIECDDLVVGRHILWSDLADREAVGDWVDSIIHTELGEIREMAPLVAELEDQVSRYSVASAGLEDWSRVVYRAQALLNQIAAGDHARPEWEDLQQRLERARDCAIDRGETNAT